MHPLTVHAFHGRPRARAGTGLWLALLASACERRAPEEPAVGGGPAAGFEACEAFDASSDGSLVPRAGSGWISLFGEDRAGWEVVGGAEGVALEDGVLAFSAAESDGYVRTAADYEDFRLRLDFKIARMANSGVFLRGARDGSDPAYSGCELQILDDFDWEQVTGKALQPFQFTGGLYGSRAPAEHALRALGEWNTYAIEYRGSRLWVELNGRVIHDLDTHALPGKPPFAERAPRGFIGLQRHAPRGAGDAPYAWFRNVFVQPLERR